MRALRSTSPITMCCPDMTACCRLHGRALHRAFAAILQQVSASNPSNQSQTLTTPNRTTQNHTDASLRRRRADTPAGRTRRRRRRAPSAPSVTHTRCRGRGKSRGRGRGRLRLHVRDVTALLLLAVASACSCQRVQGGSSESRGGLREVGCGGAALALERTWRRDACRWCFKQQQQQQQQHC